MFDFKYTHKVPSAFDLSPPGNLPAHLPACSLLSPCYIFSLLIRIHNTYPNMNSCPFSIGLNFADNMVTIPPSQKAWRNSDHIVTFKTIKFAFGSLQAINICVSAIRFHILYLYSITVVIIIIIIQIFIVTVHYQKRENQFFLFEFKIKKDHFQFYIFYLVV